MTEGQGSIRSGVGNCSAFIVREYKKRWRNCIYHDIIGVFDESETLKFGGFCIVKIIEYFSTDNKEYWLSKIKESDWGAGQWLYELLKNQKLKEYVGENTRVLMLVDGDSLISFCTLADKDDIQPTELTPWIGWVYTFPNYRGRRYVGKLLSYAEALAKADGMDSIYISTNHNGLYEKYGYEFFEMMQDMHGEDSRVYVRHI